MIYQIEYRTRWGENLAMHTADGRFIEFSTADGIIWTGEADIQAGTEYRYCVMRDGNMIRTEVGCMPHVADVHSSQHDTVTDRWKETERVAGAAVPVFSLRSKGSQGVGDFGDLKKLIDWAVKAHLKVIQILPINDTTTDGNWKDSYPYNSISCRALHPMYLDLRREGITLPAPSQPDTHLDYEAVNKTKGNVSVNSSLKRVMPYWVRKDSGPSSRQTRTGWQIMHSSVPHTIQYRQARNRKTYDYIISPNTSSMYSYRKWQSMPRKTVSFSRVTFLSA